MTSRAEQFFSQITSATDPAAFLRGLVTPESEIHDYKAGAALKPGDIRRLWAKALSGFGNTEGGVVIFGIDCRRIDVPDANGVVRKLDVPQGLDVHPDPPALAQTLRDLLRDATESPVQGVQIEPIPNPGGGGFVVCFVPNGNDKPYRSAVDGVYYMRVQDGFISMSRSLLRSLFFPRTKPRLRLTVRPNVSGGSLIDFHGSLENTGTATARDMVVSIKAKRPLQSLTAGSEHFRDPSFLPAHNTDTCRLIAVDSLHPGDRFLVFIGRWNHNNRREEFAQPPHFSVSVFMTDQESVHFTAPIPLTELLIPKAETYDPDGFPA